MVVAICSLVPVRAEASEGAEMLTQLLYGEVCEVLERVPRWTRIRSLRDNQEGWVDFKMVATIPSGMESACSQYNAVVTSPVATITNLRTNEQGLLVMGTRLTDYQEGCFRFLGDPYKIAPSNVAVLLRRREITDVVHMAQLFMGAPYLWGGKSLLGMDCSGLTQIAYATIGIELLRNAREQITQGETIPSLAYAKEGDLLFFDHADRDPQQTNISHVGMSLGEDKVLHASGIVHIATIRNEGIFDKDGHQTHHLVAIRRYR